MQLRAVLANPRRELRSVRFQELELCVTVTTARKIPLFLLKHFCIFEQRIRDGNSYRLRSIPEVCRMYTAIVLQERQ
jgi:hypothetical protein